jgi:hypothetical protein
MNVSKCFFQSSEDKSMVLQGAQNERSEIPTKAICANTGYHIFNRLQRAGGHAHPGPNVSATAAVPYLPATSTAANESTAPAAPKPTSATD